MTDKPAKPRNIDEYIAGFPESTQQALQELRATIRKAAPGAKETISYQIPTFKLAGNLVHFAAYKKHIGFYPAASGIEKFKKELEPFETAKGSVRFPLGEPTFGFNLPNRQVQSGRKFGEGGAQINLRLDQNRRSRNACHP